MKTPVLLLSYIPLYPYDAASAGKLVPPSELKDLPDVRVLGCIWARRDDGVEPLFVLDNAKSVVDHLLSWCEGKPEIWFTYFIGTKDSAYAIGLVPNLDMSVKRWEFGHRLNNPESDLDIANLAFQVYFNPLMFQSGSSATFNQIKGEIGSNICFSFIDIVDVDSGDLSSIDVSKIYRIGPLKRTDNEEYARQWCQSPQTAEV
jgi:hypothetical protein